jgi:hypothetical protein
MVSNASAATVTIVQNISGRVAAGSIVSVGMWIRRIAAVSGSSTLAIRVTGTGFTTVNLFNANPSTLTTSYAFIGQFVRVPLLIPSDLSLEITWTTVAGVTATEGFLIANAAMGIATDIGGVQYTLFAGATNFSPGTFTNVTSANTNLGVFQTFFNRFYGVQLPSSGSPSIANSLATAI